MMAMAVTTWRGHRINPTTNRRRTSTVDDDTSSLNCIKSVDDRFDIVHSNNNNNDGEICAAEQHPNASVRSSTVDGSTSIVDGSICGVDGVQQQQLTRKPVTTELRLRSNDNHIINNNNDSLTFQPHGIQLLSCHQSYFSVSTVFPASSPVTVNNDSVKKFCSSSSLVTSSCVTRRLCLELVSLWNTLLKQLSRRRRFRFPNMLLPNMYIHVTTLLLIVSLVFTTTTEACSSRSTPKPRPPASPIRPNITFPTYACPPAYATWYCLNGATCFTVEISESILYNCVCAEGFTGPRCEFKDLDGSYLPSKEKIMIEKASIASGVTIAILLMVIISIAVYIYSRRRRKEKNVDQTDIPDSSPRPFNKLKSQSVRHQRVPTSHSHPNPHQDVEAGSSNFQREPSLPYYSSPAYTNNGFSLNRGSQL
ncbi:hypothetical protein CHUAL_002540 [Chamberlinius hualienensis]